MAWRRNQVYTITGNTPDSETVAVVGSAVTGLEQFDWFSIVAVLDAGTLGGTLDATLQYKIDADTDVWVDWISFNQVLDTASSVQQVHSGANTTIVTVGTCTTASPAITLAAGTACGGHPGNIVRLVVSTGAGTDTAVEQTVYIRGWRQRK